MERQKPVETWKLEWTQMARFADESTQRLKGVFKFDFNTWAVNSFVWAMEQAHEKISASENQNDFNQSVLAAIESIKSFFAGKNQNLHDFQLAVVDFKDYMPSLEFVTDWERDEVEELIDYLIMLSAEFKTL